MNEALHICLRQRTDGLWKRGHSGLSRPGEIGKSQEWAGGNQQTIRWTSVLKSSAERRMNMISMLYQPKRLARLGADFRVDPSPGG